MAGESSAERIEALADLRSRGLISAEEFAREKAALLASIGAAEPADGPRRPPPLPPSETGPPVAASATRDWKALPRLSDAELVEQLRPKDVEPWAALWRARRAEADELAGEAKRAGARRRRVEWWAGYLALALQLRAATPPFWAKAAPPMAAWLFGALGIIVAVTLGLGFWIGAALALLSAVAGLVLAAHLWIAPADDALAGRKAQLEAERQALRDQLRALDERRAAAEREAAELDQTCGRLRRILEGRQYQLAHTEWRLLRGVAFENFLEEVFRHLGYGVETTKTTGDQGVDLIVSTAHRRVAVQVKGHADSVGNAAVQQAHAGMAFYQCQASAVVTNSGFTGSARQLAERIGCRLIDGEMIPDLIVGRISL
jgi:hypothetical protein